METLFDQPTKQVEHVPMGTALVEHEQTTALEPLIIYQRAVESGISADSLEKISALCERWESNRAADAYGNALATFQAKCPQIVKARLLDLGGGKGPLYASYDDIDAVVRPIMAACGLSKTFSADINEAGQMRVVCKIRHGRHTEESEVTFPVPAQMRVNDTQKMAAALSYAKRYCLCAALDIVVSAEDRDGEGLVQTITEEQIATLKELIESTGADMTRFLKWCAIKELKEMSQEFFQQAIFQLKRKGAK